MKTCRKCGRGSSDYRPHSWICRDCERAWGREYHKKRRAVDPEFRERANVRAKAWALAHPELTALRARKAKLKNKYGLTPEQEALLRKKQGGLCAFQHCGRVATDVDHIEIDGKPWVRGILCHHHNTALGYLYDRPEDAEDAAAYLWADARCRVVLVS